MVCEKLYRDEIYIRTFGLGRDQRPEEKVSKAGRFRELLFRCVLLVNGFLRLDVHFAKFVDVLVLELAVENKFLCTAQGVGVTWLLHQRDPLLF